MIKETILKERIRIGSRIVKLRKEKNWSQAQLGEMCDMKQQNIQRIESGKYSTGQDILTKISFALDVKLDFF